MKSLIVAAALIGSTAFAGQGMQMPPPPPELQKVAFMTGKWAGTMKIYGMGPNPSNGKASIVAKKTMDNRYIQADHVMSMGQMGKMEGMHLLSFDPFKKAFVAFWFDSSSPGVMEMTGNFQGTSLIMISKPTSIPGMPEPMTMRSTYVKQSNTRYTFKLEHKQGDKWAPMITGEYRKIG